MTQGMFSSITGIQANQVRMDVIADNIANINTVAFKSSMVNFETVFSRTTTTGTAPVGTLGGTNPQQIGLGVAVGEITRDFSQGNVQSTGRASDLNIQGEGFFVLENGGAVIGAATGILLTRAGNFTLDAEGYMVNPNGLKVIGTDDVTATSTITGQNIYLPPTLNIDKTTVPGSVTIDTAGGAGEDVYLTSYSISNDGAIEATYSNGDRISVITDPNDTTSRVLVLYPSDGGTAYDDRSGGGSTITVNNNALFDYNMQIQCATVTNSAGLTSVGSNLFSLAVNSGTPTYSIGQAGAAGLIASGGLETSNVDLTEEFSLMMLSQRALEASSRSFDAHNSVLQTIVNLAR